MRKNTGKKVFLIRFSSLGDLVLLTSTLELLYSLGSSVTLIVKAEYRELFVNDPRVKRLITFDKDTPLFQLIKEVRKESYDYAFDLHKKPFSYLLLKALRAEKKFSYRKRSLERRMAVWFKKRIHEKSVIELYAEPIFKAFGINLEVPAPKILINEETSFVPEEEYAVLGIGARHESKVWPYFGEMALMIRKEFGILPVLVGDKGDLRYLQKFPEESSPLNLVGKTSISQLATLIKNSKFVISNDSGVGHIAASYGVPTLVFFGPTIPEFGFRPIGEKALALEYEGVLRCRPCSLHGEKPCRRKDKLCLSGIPPERVLNSIRRLL